MSDIGALVPGRWHDLQDRWRMGATSLVNVTAVAAAAARDAWPPAPCTPDEVLTTPSRNAPTSPTLNRAVNASSGDRGSSRWVVPEPYIFFAGLIVCTSNEPTS